MPKKRVIDDVVCSFCQKASEDILHAMWSYDTIQPIWLPSFTWLHSHTNQLKTISNLVGVVLSVLARLDVFAMVAWSVWCRRNKIRCNEQSKPINKVFEAAMAMLTEFQWKFPSRGPKLKQPPAKWKPPATRELKANFDGAVVTTQGKAIATSALYLKKTSHN